MSFDLRKGESLALIGPNGAGKTTILKLLARITAPTTGRIACHGRLAALIELGAGFHPELTGRENIFLNGVLLGLDRRAIADRFDEIVAFSELERFLDTPLKRYSSGMSVRLGFAVAACITPDILLVDEVLAVGDTSFRQKCLNRITQLLQEGTSIVFVSHNLWLVQSVCPSAVYLRGGQVRERGETSSVIEAYDRDVHQERAAALDASGSERTGEGGEIDIVAIEIRDRQGKLANELRPDDLAEIRVRYAAYRALGAVSFVVRIRRSDGLTCCMMRSKLDNVEISVQQGEGCVSVVVDPLQLYGGSYFLQVVVRDADDADTITSRSSEWFYVTGAALSHETMNGVFEPRRRWILADTDAERREDSTHKNG